MDTQKTPEEYYKSLPKKYMGAGALLFNEESKFLIVKPTYKPGWEIPGGIVEAEEAPADAAVREIQEEIGLELKNPTLLSLQYVPNIDSKGDRLLFIFDGGTLSQEQIDLIHLPVTELSEYKFISETEVPSFFEDKKNFQDRILAAVQAKKQNTFFYLEAKE